MCPSPIMPLLTIINETGVVETFHYFPEVNNSGQHKIEKEDVDYLIAEGLIKETRKDAFGKILGLTDKAKKMLQHSE